MHRAAPFARAQMRVGGEAFAGAVIHVLRQGLIAVPHFAVQFRAAAAAIPRHALESGGLRLVAQHHALRVQHDAVRRAGRDIDAIARLEREAVGGRALHLDRAAARQQEQQRVLGADQMERLRPVVAADVNLNLDVLGQHRHGGAYFAAGFMVWRSNSRPAIAVLLCAAYLSQPQAATGKGWLTWPHLPQVRRASSRLNSANRSGSTATETNGCSPSIASSGGVASNSLR